jgi:hypothetical protein
MAFCNTPWHRHRVDWLNFIFKNTGKTLLKLPRWTADKEGRPPRRAVLSIYHANNELEWEIEMRPCKRCIRRLVYFGAGIRRAKLDEIAPEFSSYIGWEPTDRELEDLYRTYKRKFRETMDWLRIAAQVLEEKFGKAPGWPPSTPKIMEPKEAKK